MGFFGRTAPVADDVAERLTALREEIAARKAEHQAVTTAAVPLDEALARMTQLIDRLAAGWRPRLVLGAIMSPAMPLVDPGDLMFPAADQARSLLPFLAATCRTAIVAHLEATLRRQYAEAAPDRIVPTAERASRLATLAARIRDLEMEEETLIVTAAARGHEIDRRDDIDPAVVLGVDLDGARIA